MKLLDQIHDPNFKAKQQFAIDLWNAYNNQSIDNFTCQLFRLMAKADSKNFILLRSAFPIEGELFEEWRTSTEENSIWETYGVDPRKIEQNEEDSNKESPKTHV